MRKFKLDDHESQAPGAEDLSKYKDFGKVVSEYSKLTHDLHRKPLYKDKRLFIFVVIALLLLYLIFEAGGESKESPVADPPASSQPFDPETGS